ncbi:hypothetical protein NPIL_98501 [Nephila pilipes]|uniref:Uncharacterized protein n=1 Tax=Nephila pilipes TaxID=299642 RepID=A0A8X6MCH8_NEPPI|nr:hypothetical protein NPIL_98501 [Nephila pilipes]
MLLLAASDCVQYFEKIKHLKVGASLDFDMTYDEKTGNTISSSICKITLGVAEAICEGISPDDKVLITLHLLSHTSNKETSRFMPWRDGAI